MDFENIYNTYSNTIAEYGDFELPVPTFVIDKKIDFKLLIALLLRSNNNIQDDYRYLDYCKLNIKELCMELDISSKTLKSRMKYLEDKGILKYVNSSRGLILRINYNKEGKYYVKVSHATLKCLLESLSNDSIKVYFLLKIYYEIFKNNKPVTLAYLCNQLGYATNNKRNLDNMSRWSNELVEHDLVEKNKFRIYKQNSNGKKVIERVDTYYKIKR